MGNKCVHGKLTKNGIFHALFWWFRPSSMLTFTKNKAIKGGEATSETKEPEGAIVPVQNKPPEVVKIEKGEAAEEGGNGGGVQQIAKTGNEKEKPAKSRKPNNVKRMVSAGMQVDSVLKTKTGNLKDFYKLGDKLGNGQFGVTFVCVENATGNKYACKSISKRKLVTKEDVEDVRREIEIMHHLAGHPNVISIKDSYEDSMAVHVVMELCTGGELFDRIVKRGHYSERQAAELTRTIVGVIQACHSMGVMHRDLKPENFLFVSEEEDSPLKTIDFGLSTFFKPGIIYVLSFFLYNSFLNMCPLPTKYNSFVLDQFYVLLDIMQLYLK